MIFTEPFIVQDFSLLNPNLIFTEDIKYSISYITNLTFVSNTKNQDKNSNEKHSTIIELDLHMHYDVHASCNSSEWGQLKL